MMCRNLGFQMLTTVIFSGGSGTRLWPLSRESRPKQLLAPTGQHTMLQETARHLNGFGGGNLGCTPTIVVCNHEHRLMVAEQLRATGVEGVRIALEPIDRNTAPALTLTACLPVRDGRAHTVLVMSADHVFTDSDAFHAAVSLGHDAARSHDCERAPKPMRRSTTTPRGFNPPPAAPSLRPRAARRAPHPPWRSSRSSAPPPRAA